LNKKTIILVGIIFISLLFFSACKKTARVEVENDGDITIRATVAGTTDTVPPYSSAVWEITWKSMNPNSERVIELFAEPIDYQGYNDSETIVLKNKDYYLWQTGWVFVSGHLTKSKKKERE
jgi:hypothetical protein